MIGWGLVSTASEPVPQSITTVRQGEGMVCHACSVGFHNVCATRNKGKTYWDCDCQHREGTRSDSGGTGSTGTRQGTGSVRDSGGDSKEGTSVRGGGTDPTGADR